MCAVLLMSHVNDAVDIVVIVIFDTTSVGFTPISDTFSLDLI